MYGPRIDQRVALASSLGAARLDGTRQEVLEGAQDRPSSPAVGCQACDVVIDVMIEVGNRTKKRARPPRGDAAEQISGIFSRTPIFHYLERG